MKETMQLKEGPVPSRIWMLSRPGICPSGTYLGLRRDGALVGFQAPQEADPWPVGSSPSDDIEKEGGRQGGPEVTLASELQISQSSRITADGLSLSPGQPGSAAAALVGSTMRWPRALCAHLTPPSSPSPLSRSALQTAPPILAPRMGLLSRSQGSASHHNLFYSKVNVFVVFPISLGQEPCYHDNRECPLPSWSA